MCSAHGKGIIELWSWKERGDHLAQIIYFIDEEPEGPEEAFNFVNSPLEPWLQGSTNISILFLR